jgi:hypothetical protein
MAKMRRKRSPFMILARDLLPSQAEATGVDFDQPAGLRLINARGRHSWSDTVKESP